jgi:hypothetical protein
MLVREPFYFYLYSCEQIIDMAKNDAATNNLVILVSVNERAGPQAISGVNLYTEIFRQHCQDAKILYVFNNTFSGSDIWCSQDDDIIFLEWFEILTYLNILRGQKVNNQCNNNGRGLFKVGKLYNRARLATMRILIEHKLLDEIDYSMFISEPDTGLYQRIQQTHSELTGGDPNIDYLLPYVKNLDLTGTPFTRPTRDDYHYTGFPYDPAIYSRTSYSIVCETDWGTREGNPWITEKTYITIANQHPYLLLAERTAEEYLRRLGYLTYDILTPTLREIHDDILAYGVDAHINSHFVQAITHIKELINSDYGILQGIARYNYNMFLKRNQMNQDLMNEFTLNHKLPQPLEDILYGLRYKNSG